MHTYFYFWKKNNIFRESNERREESTEESTELANTTDVAIDNIELSQLIGEDFNTVKKKRHGWHQREGRILSQDQDGHNGHSRHQDEEMDLSLAPSSRSLEWWRRLSSEFNHQSWSLSYLR